MKTISQPAFLLLKELHADQEGKPIPFSAVGGMAESEDQIPLFDELRSAGYAFYWAQLNEGAIRHWSITKEGREKAAGSLVSCDLPDADIDE